MTSPFRIVTTLAFALVAAGTLALGGCATFTARSDSGGGPATSTDGAQGARRAAPDAVGAVAAVTVGADAAVVTFDPDEGYDYFEGAALTIPLDAAFGVDGEQALDLEALKEGDRIRVWAPVCAESYPVQCTVEAVTAD